MVLFSVQKEKAYSTPNTKKREKDPIIEKCHKLHAGDRDRE
jgi:hypothetical protein